MNDMEYMPHDPEIIAIVREILVMNKFILENLIAMPKYIVYDEPGTIRRAA